MNIKEIFIELEALGNEKVRAQNRKKGAGDNQFGLLLGNLRKLAKKIKSNHPLAIELWETKNIDARLLAILLLQPNELSTDEVDAMVRSISFVQVADWFNAYVVKKHPKKEQLRLAWMNSTEPMTARAGWALTAEQVAKNPHLLDLPALLKRIESEMAQLVPEIQWTMNFALAEIGIQFPQHREQAIAIGETLGIYRDFPVSKGCTSPFAPIWIKEIVSRQN